MSLKLSVCKKVCVSECVWMWDFVCENVHVSVYVCACMCVERKTKRGEEGEGAGISHGHLNFPS